MDDTLRLRRHAIARNLAAPLSLPRAVERMGFVQADPIRAPARAQDLILLQRVRTYRAGDLERRYAALGLHEDFFVNYGFVTPALHACMHPRAGCRPLGAAATRRARALLDYVAARGSVHPREVDAHFAHGGVTNAWGGTSSATTDLLDALHYRGRLRVLRRDSGIRVYALHPGATPCGGAVERRRRVDALVDVLVAQYGPLPARTLSELVRRLRLAVPQWRAEVEAALRRAVRRLPQRVAGGHTWFLPEAEADALAAEPDLPDGARLLAPFDPLVWDRRRFEAFWGWPYRFEAYVPAPRRQLGYYALPLLWGDAMIGWGNLAVDDGVLTARIGLRDDGPRGRAAAPLRRAVQAEVERYRVFLGAADARVTW